MIDYDTSVKGMKVHVPGLTFKENVPDLRNSRVIDLIDELKFGGVEMHVHDPVASSTEAMHAYLEMPLPDYFRNFVKGGCFIDVKSKFDKDASHSEGVRG